MLTLHLSGMQSSTCIGLIHLLEGLLTITICIIFRIKLLEIHSFLVEAIELEMKITFALYITCCSLIFCKVLSVCWEWISWRQVLGEKQTCLPFLISGSFLCSIWDRGCKLQNRVPHRTFWKWPEESWTSISCRTSMWPLLMSITLQFQIISYFDKLS